MPGHGRGVVPGTATITTRTILTIDPGRLNDVLGARNRVEGRQPLTLRTFSPTPDVYFSQIDGP